MKGIVLAGGAGTRLYPITKCISKQLLPIYDKPMIYYPLSILIQLDIKDILLITTPEDLNTYKKLLSNGENLGITLTYEIQSEPRGIADAFKVGKHFIGKDSVALILGDNIFYGEGLIEKLIAAKKNKKGATIFGYYVDNPSAYGVVEFDDKGKVIAIEEKPKKPKSNYAVPGLYFYDNNVVDIAHEIKPSDRGELEITAVNEKYLKEGDLYVELLSKDVTWFDTGTYEGLIGAATFVMEKYKEEGIVIGCIEASAFDRGYITKEHLERLIEGINNSTYRQYLEDIIVKN